MLAVLALLALGFTSCTSLTKGPPLAGRDEPLEVQGLRVLQWPSNKAPGGFMQGLLLVAIPVEQSRTIVEKAAPSETPYVKPAFKTPLEAAQYFGTHLNMGEPPRYMAVHVADDARKYYIFWGGRHWRTMPPFTKAAVLLESGEIRSYK